MYLRVTKSPTTLFYVKKKKLLKIDFRKYLRKMFFYFFKAGNEYKK